MMQEQLSGKHTIPCMYFLHSDSMYLMSTDNIHTYNFFFAIILTGNIPEEGAVLN